METLLTLVESGEYIEEDEPETKFVPPKKKPKIFPEGGGNEERDPVEEGSGSESDTGSEPERYNRQTQSDELYQDILGIKKEDDADEEEKEVSFYF